jgi:hypothetical protein
MALLVSSPVAAVADTTLTHTSWFVVVEADVIDAAFVDRALVDTLLIAVLLAAAVAMLAKSVEVTDDAPTSSPERSTESESEVVAVLEIAALAATVVASVSDAAGVVTLDEKRARTRSAPMGMTRVKRFTSEFLK